MPQSLSEILIHLVFSTKDRTPWITSDLRPQLDAYLATVVREHGCECFRAGGMPDHEHLAIRLSRTTSIAKLVEEVKTSSSKWMKTKGVKDFSWQRGYGAFSLSRSDLEALRNYIDTQETHHSTRTFQDEFRAILFENGVEFDERYIWD